MRLLLPVMLAGMMLCRASCAHAEVVWASDGGFEVREVVHVATLPPRAFEQFTANVGTWWSDEHTWSGSAKNLTIQPVAGGCFCEKLPDGGGVEHLHVVFARPGVAISLSGGLGPLQALAFHGVMRVTFAAQAGGTEVTLVYRVHGSDPKGAGNLAAPVDGMLSATLKRYQRFSDTGSPEQKP